MAEVPAGIDWSSKETHLCSTSINAHQLTVEHAERLPASRDAASALSPSGSPHLKGDEHAPHVYTGSKEVCSPQSLFEPDERRERDNKALPEQVAQAENSSNSPVAMFPSHSNPSAFASEKTSATP